jgi:hypothetical protein
MLARAAETQSCDRARRELEEAQCCVCSRCSRHSCPSCLCEESGGLSRGAWKTEQCGREGVEREARSEAARSASRGLHDAHQQGAARHARRAGPRPPPAPARPRPPRAASAHRRSGGETSFACLHSCSSRWTGSSECYSSRLNGPARGGTR